MALRCAETQYGMGSARLLKAASIRLRPDLDLRRWSFAGVARGLGLPLPSPFFLSIPWNCLTRWVDHLELPQPARGRELVILRASPAHSWGSSPTEYSSPSSSIAV